MKIIFIINQIKQDGLVPEKVFGCSYSIYPTPDLAVLYNAAVLEKDGNSVSLFYVKKINDLEYIPLADTYFINSVILSYESDIRIAKEIPNNTIPLYFFGPYPTLFPEKYLFRTNIFVLRGETEHCIGSALKNPSKSKGVSYLKDGKIIHNQTAGIIENLDTIPFPLRRIDSQNYRNPKLPFKKFTNVLASRGCANRCYFCVPNSISWARELEWKRYNNGKPPVKTRSAENVVEELKLLKKEGYEVISFIDDQFIVGKNRVIQIAKAMGRLGLKYGILARADKLKSEEIVKALAESNCKYVDIGAESFNQDVLDDIKKDIKVETILESIRLLSKNKIEPKINIMFGTSLKENEQIINQTIKKTLELPTTHCMFSIATPFPGTDFQKIAQKNGWIIKKDDANPASTAQVSYPHLTALSLEKLVRKANRKFFLRPRIVKSFAFRNLSIRGFFINFRLFINWLRNFT